MIGRQLTNETLYEKCELTNDWAYVQDLHHDMLAILYKSETGVGLAANQIGETVRVIVIHTPDVKECMVNPKIEKSFGNVKSIEGCLSFPGKTVTITRAKQITVSWCDRYGNTRKRKYRGLAAKVIQHEIDHLNGIVCIDY